MNLAQMKECEDWRQREVKTLYPLWKVYQLCGGPLDYCAWTMKIYNRAQLEHNGQQSFAE